MINHSKTRIARQITKRAAGFLQAKPSALLLFSSAYSRRLHT